MYKFQELWMRIWVIDSILNMEQNAVKKWYSHISHSWDFVQVDFIKSLLFVNDTWPFAILLDDSVRFNLDSEKCELFVTLKRHVFTRQKNLTRCCWSIFNLLVIIFMVNWQNWSQWTFWFLTNGMWLKSQLCLWNEELQLR